MNLSFLGFAILALVVVGIDGLSPSKIVGKTDQVQKVCADQPLYQISLWETVEGQPYFICGGVILEENLFLTAAHCLNGTHFPLIQIKAGCVDLKGNGEHRIVNRVYIHEGYSLVTKRTRLETSEEIKNDIAIFTVDRPLVLGPRIKRARLPSVQGTDIVSKTGEIAGWGNTERYGDYTQSRVLLKTQMKVIARNHPACYKWVDDNQFCALDFPNYTSTGAGDSGSPFTIDDTVYGIVSAGHSGRLHATVYTKVQSYLDWIGRIRTLDKSIINERQGLTPPPKQPSSTLKKNPPPTVPSKPTPAPRRL